MSFDAQEKSTAGAQPWEAFLFQTTGQSFYLTSSDQSMTYLGQPYTPTTIRRDEYEETSEVDSGEMKIYIPASHPLAALFIPYLPPSPMAITIYGGHFGDTEVLALYSGTVASANFTIDGECELICRSSKYLLQRKIPKMLYQQQCNHVFCDAGCTLNIASFTYPGAVSAIDSTGTIITVPAFASLPHSLKGGYLAKGNNVRAIVAHSGSSITLMAPMIGLAVGNSVNGIAGCQHTYGACSGYSNIANFAGFDLIPTINPFDQTTSLN